MRKFFALFAVLFLLTAGTLPAVAAKGDPVVKDSYHIGSIGPIEVRRPFLVHKSSLQLLPSWKGYYFGGQTIAQGSLVLENQAPDAFRLLIWADPEGLKQPSAFYAVVIGLRAAQHGPKGLAPWVNLDGNLMLRSGETWTVEYQVVVSLTDYRGSVERIDIRIEHVPVCPGPDGVLGSCAEG